MSDVHNEDFRGQHLLSDADVARFVATGYHLIEPQLADGLNETIADRLDGMTTNSGTRSRRKFRNCGRSSNIPS